MPEGLVDEADFFPGAWESTEVGGTSYGVPWYVETRALYYRTDLAEQAGWSQPPATWDELHQFATDLQPKAGAANGLQLQAGKTGAWQTMMPFAWSAGAELTDADGAEYTLDSPEMVEGLEYYSSFFADGLSSTDKLDPGELENGMADGTIGSFISGPWHADLVEEAGVSPDQYAIAPLPGTDSAPGNSFVGGGDLAVFSDADNKDGAWKFVQWLSEPETQQAFYDEVGDLPAVQSAWDSGELADDPQLQVFGAAAREGQLAAGRPELGRGRERDRQRHREGHQGAGERRGGGQVHAGAGRVHRHRPLRTRPWQRARPAPPARRAGTSTPRGARKPSPRGCSPCRSCCCSWRSPRGRSWPASG